METLIFENGTTAVNLETLKRTVRSEMANGKLPKSRPVEHFQLLEEITERADRLNLAPKIGNIYATERQSRRINWLSKEQPCPVENYLIDRMAVKIDLMPTRQGQNLALGIGYNERGISLAYGTNIHVCSNMQIFGGRLVQTFNNGVTFEEMLKTLQNWFEQFGEISEANAKRIDELNTIDIDHEVISSTIGDLFTRAVKLNAGEKVIAPLNQVQVADLVKSQALDVYAHQGQHTAYDLLQWGTHYLKPRRADLVTLNQTQAEFTAYIEERFLN